MKNKEKIGVIQHGCAKNLVDVELMLGILENAGYLTTLDVDDPDVKTVVINTCSFICDAEKESIKSIFDMVQMGKRIIVTGCLPQKHKKELQELLSEVSGFIGTCDIKDIVQAVESDEFYSVSENPEYIYPEDVKRSQITIGCSSYIKIAEGCNYSCGYCVIPQLRGKYKSRTIENIVEEANELAQKGVSEIILIAQDTTGYGIDLYGKPMLYKLLEELNKIDEIDWIRVMYAYPINFDDNLINAFKTLDKVVKYVDIPLQHSHPDVLRRMRRPVIDNAKFVEKLRKEIPNVVVRTSLIVGYPQETEEEFNHLYEFVKNVKFDRLGVFEFSREKNTYSYSLKPQIKAGVKRSRKKELMKLQSEISKEKNKNYLSKEICCIIEYIHPDGYAVARSQADAPEVDGIVYIESEKYLQPGDIVIATVYDYNEYDLYAKA